MGMSWVAGNALLRNAIIAAGNRGDPAVRSEVERFTASGEPLLRKTALWAMGKLSAGGRRSEPSPCPHPYRR
jgi:epoxyqueuosine reductase QueG